MNNEQKTTGVAILIVIIIIIAGSFWSYASIQRERRASKLADYIEKEIIYSDQPFELTKNLLHENMTLRDFRFMYNSYGNQARTLLQFKIGQLCTMQIDQELDLNYDTCVSSCEEIFGDDDV